MYSTMTTTNGHAILCSNPEKNVKPKSLLGTCPNCKATWGKVRHGCYHWLLQVMSPDTQDTHPPKAIKWPPPDYAPCTNSGKH